MGEIIGLPKRPPPVRSQMEIDAGVARAQELIGPAVARAMRLAHKHQGIEAADLCHALIQIGVTYFAASAGPATIAQVLDRVSSALKAIAAEDFSPGDKP